MAKYFSPLMSHILNEELGHLSRKYNKSMIVLGIEVPLSPFFIKFFHLFLV